MPLSRRRRPPPPPRPPGGADIAWERLARVVDEAIVLQDSTEALLTEIRGDASLREMARRGGPMIRRFEALRDELPACSDPAVRLYSEPLDVILANHSMVLSSALELLAVSWRSERMAAELRRIGGLGGPGRRLEALRADLDARR